MLISIERRFICRFENCIYFFKSMYKSAFNGYKNLDIFIFYPSLIISYKLFLGAASLSGTHPFHPPLRYLDAKIVIAQQEYSH